MRKLSGIALVACATAISLTAFAQRPVRTPLGYGENPNQETPKYTLALGDENTAAAAATATTYTGILILNFTIRMVTPVPSGGGVFCSLNASVADFDLTTFTIYNNIFETETGTGSVSGSIAHCTARIPYSWSLVQGSTDLVTLYCYLYLVGPSSSAATAVRIPIRESFRLIPGATSIDVPPTGTITNFSISTIL
jgi:hypothetical protein